MKAVKAIVSFMTLLASSMALAEAAPKPLPMSDSYRYQKAQDDRREGLKLVDEVLNRLDQQCRETQADRNQRIEAFINQMAAIESQGMRRWSTEHIEALRKHKQLLEFALKKMCYEAGIEGTQLLYCRVQADSDWMNPVDCTERYQKSLRAVQLAVTSKAQQDQADGYLKGFALAFTSSIEERMKIDRATELGNSSAPFIKQMKDQNGPRYPENENEYRP